MKLRVLDLFSAAAGGWSLGMHRAGFQTVAACEYEEWRRAVYSQNNPGVVLYDDVRTLTAARLLRDLEYLPDIIVGSPPCQDISSANTKGKGVDGERSGLFFEAIRIAKECRELDPWSARWVALENSANVRTRGYDRIADGLEAIGYTCELLVVGADDLGANHQRKRAWIIAFDASQIGHAGGRPWGYGPHGYGSSHPAESYAADAYGNGRTTGRGGRWSGLDVSLPHDRDGTGPVADAAGIGRGPWSGNDEGADAGVNGSFAQNCSRSRNGAGAGDASDADQAGQADGCLVSSLRQAEEPVHGCGVERRDDVAHADQDGQPDGSFDAEMGGSESSGLPVAEPWSHWNGGLASHLRLDDGLSAWLAGTRIAVGGPKGTVAASLAVEAFGDAVIPQIPEAIGRAILRVEAALACVSSIPQLQAAE